MKERKAYHVERTKKANQLERQRLVERLNSVDFRAKQVKDDRLDFMASRKLMVLKLKKDLERMRVGLVSMHEIENKYAFLHDDKEFLAMMHEIKNEIHPGNSY